MHAPANRVLHYGVAAKKGFSYINEYKSHRISRKLQKNDLYICFDNFILSIIYDFISIFNIKCNDITCFFSFEMLLLFLLGIY